MNQVREKLKAGRVSYGVWIEVMSVELVEVCGDLGYDFAVLDAEHQTLNAMACFELVRACQLSGIAPMVRVPSDDPSVIRGLAPAEVMRPAPSSRVNVMPSNNRAR